MTLNSGARAPSRKSSQNSAAPDIWRTGWTVTPLSCENGTST